ncbi:imelysin family protein [Azospirillum sp. SYSU D00513]|uniref:imelysin family protein n=1 Tax=Azospirillum sp. SYSU D00513 TaxID=2812561 RepID=UPI0020003D88|nr:imelysin family protein [Azospirillum sp. SYSU D00513]
MRRRTMLPLLSAAVLGLLLPSGPALAERSEAGDKAFLDGLVRTHVQPRVSALASAGAELAARFERFCAAPDAAGLDSVRGGYDAAMDGWAGAQHLRPGPILLEGRSDRLAFWPERRGIVGRQLGQFLSAKDPKALEPGALAKQSAAVQGLTAIEILLHDKSPTPESFTGDEAGRYRCALGTSIARNFAALTAEVRDGWAELGPKLAAGEATAVGADARESANNLYRSVLTMIQVVVDQKLLAPLGQSLEDAKPALAESPRAGRGLRNIALNLAAMRGFLAGENGGPGMLTLLPATAEGTRAASVTLAAFDEAQAAAAAVPMPLGPAAADPQARPSAEALLRAAKKAQSHINQTLPPLLGITLGFNELDGD